MFDTILVILAGLAGGALNAVAGGGTFLTLPALILAGVPPVSANATATLTALPGYVSSVWAYRRDLHTTATMPAARMIAIAALGGVMGALLLLITPNDTFLVVVPALMALATVLFAGGPHMIKRLFAREMLGPLGAAVALFAVSVYGGYFNGGLGIMLLAVLGLIGFTDLHAMNGLKNALSVLLSLVSAVTYVLAGVIAWDFAAVLAAAMIAGGFLGAHYARRIKNTARLKQFIVLVGVVMTVIFTVRLF
ncbi:sulfite exporter TauE/SafE family protein [Celeribacter sp. HF31]|uniref:sulfite exporter TauE/SafE family protein n=1 Tax=Celeribacter sp. HF31 TaxID=2721558 RepID=UPI0014309039|nr:sulfite exporter TauE/SafE family protein [Celeribacter sp. HF31]NIY78803.1 sulfite exporter TauE/SafE family protein [Celeribacter sp. HF31]